ncbi:hypothetical protein EB796_020794 [Bugula neritina]|uniref:Uncharacterized protein n=1 Tax=Bugula neritina TaxID=10212 RepID=A0A7J7J3W2_BUGNE|nr:hypothetical protein EB796_020794 [Bugula neritina]
MLRLTSQPSVAEEKLFSRVDFVLPSCMIISTWRCCRIICLYCIIFFVTAKHKTLKYNNCMMLVMSI